MALNEAPPFWWKRHSWQGYMLFPVSYIFGKLSAKRMALGSPAEIRAPVICIGNFVVGGGGKTPTVHMIARHAISQGYKVGILTRGHGGAVTSETLVNTQKHNARDVGDEALMHAEIATTVVSPNRVTGAHKLVEEGCTLILMDDGFQNPSLHKDYCLVLADAKRGLGNGFVMPGGPMRVPFRNQLYLADAVLITGKGNAADDVIRKAARAGKPVYKTELRVEQASTFKDTKLLAFAGIADPGKFFDTLIDMGSRIVDKRAFGDHHVFLEEECADLIDRSKAQGLQLVTTEKDAARLKGMGEAQEKLLELSKVVKISLESDNPMMCARIVDTAVKRYKARKKPMAYETGEVISGSENHTATKAAPSGAAVSVNATGKTTG